MNAFDFIKISSESKRSCRQVFFTKVKDSQIKVLSLVPRPILSLEKSQDGNEATYYHMENEATYYHMECGENNYTNNYTN